MKLVGKTALVTGAGRGIGKGCALELAKAGANIVLNDRPGSPDIEATVAEIRALGVAVTPIEADAFSRLGCEQLVAEAVTAVSTLDILVSNPAWSRRQPFLEFDPDIFEQIIQATLVAGFHISQLVARHMVERAVKGKIVFISSVHAENPYQTAVAYNAAKAGLNHLGKTIARELTPHHINVNVVEPGWIDTPGERNLLSDKAIKERGPKLPWGRLGTPADIGKAVTFLSSSDSDYITGTILRVDGGFLHKDT